MKKLFAILAVAAFMTACGEAAPTEENKTADSAATTTPAVDSAAATVDSAAVKVDSAAKTVDSAAKH